jgi:branched-chain amino acid transport system substrate-binding protein
VWWSPSHPFTSSLTGQSAQDLAEAWTKETSRQWTQPIGFVHGLFEVVLDVLKRTSDVDSPEAIRDAIKATNINTIVGPISWGNGPVPNVAKTPLVGGQWQPGTDYPFDLVIATNSTAPGIPTSGSIMPKTWA